MIDTSKFTEIVDGIWYENDTGLPWSSRVKGPNPSGRKKDTLTLLTAINSDGYYNLLIDGKNKKWHRLVWEYFNGKISSQFEVDHIDNNRQNNRIDNLQLLTHQGNTRKSLIRKDNTIGFPGLNYRAKYGYFECNIMVNKKQIYLGSFATKEEAYEAYLQAKVKYHGAESIAPLTNKEK